MTAAARREKRPRLRARPVDREEVAATDDAMTAAMHLTLAEKG
jgi:hypothetical protein